MHHAYRRLWQNFGPLTVDNIINGTRFYTEDENDQYIKPYLTSEDGPRFRIDGKHGTRFYTEDENDQYIKPYLTSEDGPRFRIDGKTYDRYKYPKSFQKIIDHVVRLHADDSTYEPWPGYKAMATRMCRSYNFDPRDGNGLGRYEQGNPAPIDHNPPNLDRTVKKESPPNALHGKMSGSAWMAINTSCLKRTKYTRPL
jgi:hypothetical protein